MSRVAPVLAFAFTVLIGHCSHADEPTDEVVKPAAKDFWRFDRYEVPKRAKPIDLLPPAPKRMPWKLVNELEEVPEVSLFGADFDDLPTDGAREKFVEYLAKFNRLDERHASVHFSQGFEDPSKDRFETGFLNAVFKHRKDLRDLPFRDAKTAYDTRGRRVHLENHRHALQSILTPNSIPPKFGLAAFERPPTEPKEHEGDFEPFMVEGHNAASRVDSHRTRVRLATQMFFPTARGRLLLLKELMMIPHHDAAAAIVSLVLFAPEQAVRTDAIEALKARPKEDYFAPLIVGLDYPLPKVAEHAAVAIVRLRLTEAIPKVAEGLDHDPRIGGGWTVREVVKIPHHRNCMLCHPPAQSKSSFYLFNEFTVSVPAFGEMPVEVASVPGYVPSQVPDRVAIRFDVTYLTQDFSLMRRLNPGDKNSKLVRYDYVVRERELTKQESRNRDALASSLPKSPYYATRLNILRHLTGERDLHTAREWLAHLTNNQARFDVEGAKSLWMKSAWRGGFDWETDSWGPR